VAPIGEVVVKDSGTVVDGDAAEDEDGGSW
jgi:hypothetical protein